MAEPKPGNVMVHPMLETYYNDFKELVDVRGKQGELVLIVFSRLMEDRVLGVAYGMNVNSVVIHINANKWFGLSENQKRYLMYHELAHDILNWKHNNGTDLMTGPMPYFVSNKDIDQAENDLRNGKR